MRGSIVVRDVGKKYVSRDGGRPTTLKGYLLSGHARKRAQAQPSTSNDPFWGLRHVNFHVPPGRSVGVVGLNGAGKSTLLRLIGGVGRPDEGQIDVHGRIGALLDIGVGLTEDLTGRENVFLLGVIGGMLRAEIDAQFEEVVAFAELENYIDAPVRTYSTGMRMRLAFAVAIHTRPDVLLVDEVLAVGDKAFQQKCFERVSQIRASGCTIFLVSHDIEQIEALCDDVLFLQGGRMIAYGPLRETLALYSAAVDAKIAEKAGSLPPPAADDVELTAGLNRWGSGKMRIRSVRLHDAGGNVVDRITSGEGLHISFWYTGVEEIVSPIALIGIYGEGVTCIYETNTQLANLAIDGRGGAVSLALARLDLAPGDYDVTVGLFSSDWEQLYDYHSEAYRFRVGGAGPSKGLLNPPVEWETSLMATPALVKDDAVR